MRSLRLSPALCLFVLLATAAVCGAQTFRGGISGRVSDQSGAVLPGVAITAACPGSPARCCGSKRSISSRYSPADRPRWGATPDRR
jgi:hypothetical protein